MKKFLLISILLTHVISHCKAQPNGSFENWSTIFGIEEPDNWQTGNAFSLLSPPNPLSAFKATGIDKHSGNYALKLRTVFLNNNPDSTIFPDSFGVAFTGKVNYNPVAVTYGYPYTGRPEKLEFWAKYLPVGIDRASVGVVLKKWNGTTSDTVASGSLTFSQVLQYTLFQINLIYRSTELPDSAEIGLASSNKNAVRVGSMLFIDDLAYTGNVGIGEKHIYADKVNVFPNPAKGNVTIQTVLEEADNVKVIDALGRPYGIYKINNYKTDINTSLFAEGIYYCEIRDKKNKILTKCKFNTVK